MLQSPTHRSLVGIRQVDPTDGPAILAMGRRCSRTTLYQRFLGVVNGLSASFVEGILAGSSTQTSLVATLADEETVVGLASCSPDGQGRVEVGVLVEDAYQCQGIGSALLERLMCSQMRDGELGVTALVLTERLHVAGSLARRLGVMPAVTFHGDVAELTASLPSPTSRQWEEAGVSPRA